MVKVAPKPPSPSPLPSREGDLKPSPPVGQAFQPAGGLERPPHREGWEGEGGLKGGLVSGNHDSSTEHPCFDVDGMLGRLAKWLRILGFDAAYPRISSTIGRYFVTTKDRISGGQTIVVSGDDPMEQLKQVLTAIHVRPDQSLFFSRCLICNVPVVEIPKAEVAGRVPEEIFGSRSEFHECPQCRRVYWEGSHLSRIVRRLTSAGVDLGNGR